jgi:hypothetical protein
MCKVLPNQQQPVDSTHIQCRQTLVTQTVRQERGENVIHQQTAFNNFAMAKAQNVSKRNTRKLNCRSGHQMVIQAIHGLQTSSFHEEENQYTFPVVTSKYNQYDSAPDNNLVATTKHDQGKEETPNDVSLQWKKEISHPIPNQTLSNTQLGWIVDANLCICSKQSGTQDPPKRPNCAHFLY